MSKCHAMQFAAADQDFLGSNSMILHVPATGRDRDGATGAYLEVIIYSITLSVQGAVDPGSFGFELYSIQTDGAPVLKIADMVNAGESGTIHMTFPNGLPCGRPALDVGNSIAGNAGCYKLARQQDITSGGATILLDLQKCPYIQVFDNSSAATINIFVTYGYAHQSALQP